MKSQVLDRLGEDHRNSARLLSLLDRELDKLSRLEPADNELMRDIMLYMTRYADRVHHPLEDLMFAALASRCEDARPLVDAAEAEHGDLGSRGEAFYKALMQIVDGAMVERDEIVDAGVAYSSLLKTHMLRENERLFPMAGEWLEEAEWDDVAARFEAEKDPLFGPVTEAAFAALLATTNDSGQ